MDNMETERKVSKIGELLKQDINMEDYIKEIEERQIIIPIDLKEKIMIKVNKKKRVRYIDICKIVACLVFSLAICRTDFIRNDEISKYKEYKPKSSIVITEKLSDFCKWFTTPIGIEKEER